MIRRGQYLPRSFWAIGIICLFGASLLLLVIRPAKAQGNRIQYDRPFEGSIDGTGETNAWILEGRAGDVITISIQASAPLRPKMTLTGPEGTLLVKIDAPDTADSLTATTSLRTSGLHTLTIGGQEDSTGTYVAQVILEQPGDAGETQENILVYGQERRGTLNDEHFREFWVFRGLKDDVVDVLMSVQSGNLDAYVALVAPDGGVLVGSDTGGVGRDAALYGVRLPITGTYTVVARRAGGNLGETGTTAGRYRISIFLRNSARSQASIIPRTIANDQPTAGQLSADAPDAYFKFDGSGQIAVRLEAADPSALVTLSLITPERVTLAEFTGLGVIERGITITDQDDVWLAVTSPAHFPDSSLAFRLTAHQLSQAEAGSETIRYGQTRQIDDPSPPAKNWHFWGYAGDVVRLRYNPHSTIENAPLTVWNTNGIPVFTAITRGSLDVPLILDENGFYEITVPLPERGFSLSLELEGVLYQAFDQLYRSAALQGKLLEGVVEGTLSTTAAQSWYFDADAPTTIFLRLEQEDNNQTPLIVTVRSPENETIAVGSTRSLSGTGELTVRLPHAGRYTVAVSSPGGGQQSFTLSIFRTEGGALPNHETVTGVLSPITPYDAWTVEATEGSVMAVEVRSRQENLSPQVAVIGPDGLLVRSNWFGDNLSDLALTAIPLSEGGTYSVILLTGNVSSPLIYDLKLDIDAIVTPTISPTLFTPPASDTATTAQIKRVAIGERVVSPEELAYAISQPADPVSTEALLLGEIPAGTRFQPWVLPVAAGQTLGISVTGLDGATDPGLYIFDETDTLVSQQQAAGQTQNYLIHSFDRAASYTLLVSLEPESRYVLWVDVLPPLDLTMPQVVDGQVIAFGETVTDTVLQNETRRFVFYGLAGMNISASAITFSENASFNIKLLSIAGDVLSEQDGSGSVVLQKELPGQGIYFLEVSSSDAMTAFSLFLGLTYFPESSQPVNPRLDDSASGYLSVDETQQRWLFDARAGETISVRLWSDTAEAPSPLVLKIADTGGNVFYQVENHLASTVLQFDEQMLPRSGVYQVIVEGGQNTKGAYHLALIRQNTGLVDATQALDFGDTRGGVLTGKDVLDTWSFAATQGDTITVFVRRTMGDDAPLSIQLRSQNGTVLGTAVTVDLQPATLEHISLPLSGFYTVAVGVPDPAFDGSLAYQITVQLEGTTARSMGETVSIGDGATGYFFIDDPVDTWLVETDPSQTLTVTLQPLAGTISPTLELVSTDWHVASLNGQPAVLSVAQSIDGEPVTLSLPAISANTYALIVREPTSNRGQYRLSLSAESSGSERGALLRPNTPRVGEIGTGQPSQKWRVTVDEPSEITVTLIPDNRTPFFPAFILTDPRGVPLAFSETGTRETLTLEAYLLVGVGEYQIEIGTSRWNQRMFGRYTIEYSQRPISLSPADTLVYGQPAQGRIDDVDVEQNWFFSGEADTTVSLTLSIISGELMPQIDLRTSSGFMLSPTHVVSSAAGLYVSYSLPETDRYRVIVRGYGSIREQVGGNYTLLLQKAYQTTATLTEEQQRKLVYGSQVAGTLDAASPIVRWPFAGTAGDVVQVTLRFPITDAPPALTLRDPGGNILEQGIRDRNLMMIGDFTLPDSGNYILEVKRAADATQPFMPYRLALNLAHLQVSPPAQTFVLTPDQPYVGQFDGSGSRHAWVFKGEAGDEVVFHLTRLQGDEPSTLVLYDPDGITVLTTTVPAAAFITEPIHLSRSGFFLLELVANPSSLSSRYQLRLAIRSAAAKTVQELAEDNDAYGRIDDFQPIEYWKFLAEDGDTLVLHAITQTGNLEPQMTLFGPNGQPVATSSTEAALTDLHAVIGPFTLEESGMYQVEVTRSGGISGEGIGSYKLMRRTQDITKRAASATDIPLSIPISGRLAGGEEHSYAFNAQAGSVIVAAAIADPPGNPPSLWIESETGTQLEINTIETEHETRLPAYVVPKTGRYILNLTANGFSNYTLIVKTRLQNPPQDGPTRNLAPGGPFVEGISSVGGFTRWLFDARAGDVYSFIIDTSQGGLDADVVLYGPGGYITSGVESSLSEQVAIGPIRLFETGRYMLLVQPWLGAFGGSFGRYTVTMERAAQDVSGSYGGPIGAYDLPVTGGLTQNDPEDVWWLQGKAGERLTLTATTLQDPEAWSLGLYDPDGVLLLETAGSDTSIELDAVRLPADGLYEIVIRNDSTSPSPIEYQIVVSDYSDSTNTTLDRAQGISLGARQRSHLTTEESHEAWVFYGERGQAIRIKVTAPAGIDVFEVNLLDPAGRIMASARRGQVPGDWIIPQAVLTVNGFHVVTVSADAMAPDETILYELALEEIVAGATEMGQLEDRATGRLEPTTAIHEWLVEPPLAGDYVVRIEADSPAISVKCLVLSSTLKVLQDCYTHSDIALSEPPLRFEAGERAYVVVFTDEAGVNYSVMFEPASVYTNGGTLGPNTANVGQLSDSDPADEWEIMSSNPITLRVVAVDTQRSLDVLLYDNDGNLIGQESGLAVVMTPENTQSGLHVVVAHSAGDIPETDPLRYQIEVTGR